MMKSINAIYMPQTGIEKKTSASVKKNKLVVINSRRKSIIDMMQPGMFITASEIVRRLNFAQSTITGDLNFLVKACKIQARSNQNPYPGKGKFGREYFMAVN